MKLLFTADIHIKLGQKNVPVQWARQRYSLLFAELRGISATTDICILGGDIFDKLPSMEELELYFELLAAIQCKCYIYSGNHEALKKDTTFLSYLKNITKKATSGNVEIIDEYTTVLLPGDGSTIDILPYNQLRAYHPADMLQTSDILCTHVRGAIPPHVKPEVDLDIFSPWKVVLAGDLHSYENCQQNILYPGSPVTTSFHRERVKTGVIVLDTKTLKHEWLELNLPQLIRKVVKAGDPMPAGTYDHVIYDIEGNILELSGVESSELIDKKLVKKAEVDTSLILDTNMSILEEAEEYLRYILGISEEDIKRAIKELHSYV